MTPSYRGVKSRRFSGFGSRRLPAVRSPRLPEVRRRQSSQRSSKREESGKRLRTHVKSTPKVGYKLPHTKHEDIQRIDWSLTDMHLHICTKTQAHAHTVPAQTHTEAHTLCGSHTASPTWSSAQACAQPLNPSARPAVSCDEPNRPEGRAQLNRAVCQDGPTTPDASASTCLPLGSAALSSTWPQPHSQNATQIPKPPPSPPLPPPPPPVTQNRPQSQP